MKKILALILALALMLTVLAGCGDKKNEGEGAGQEQTQEQDGDKSGESSGEDDKKEEGSEEGKEQDEQGEEGTAPEDADLLTAGYAEFMTGRWDYINPYDYSVAMQFDFAEDGSYTASRKSGIAAKTLTYEGKWAAAEVPVANQYSSVMLPLLSMTLEKTDDEALSSLGSLGEFIIDAKATCDGRYVVYIIQYNNGDSVLSSAFGVYSAVLTRSDDVFVPEASEEVKKSESFAAFCWKLEGDESGALLWLDDRDWDTLIPLGKPEAVAYRFAEDAKVFLNTDYILGGELVEVETDAKGDIIIIAPLIRGYEDPSDLEGSQIEYFIEGRELSFSNEEGDMTIARSTYEVISLEDDDWPELAKTLEAYDTEVSAYAQQMGEQLVDGVEGMESEYLKQIVPLISEIKVRVKRSDSKVFSFTQYHYYYGGGAHPSEAFAFVNIDPVSGRVLTADDVITDRDRFMKLIRDEIKANWEYVDKLPDEIGELLVEEGGVTVLYNTYELGSYAAGNQEMFFSLEDLEGMVNMDLFVK